MKLLFVFIHYIYIYIYVLLQHGTYYIDGQIQQERHPSKAICWMWVPEMDRARLAV